MFPILGTILEVNGPSEGPSSERTYLVRWYTPDGSKFQMDECRTREYSDDDSMERRAFAVGFTVLGAMTSRGAHPKILIMDREDYAVGCE